MSDKEPWRDRRWLLPLTAYCAAFEAWYSLMQKKLLAEARSEDKGISDSARDDLAALRRVELMIRKSSLLGRLLYGGEGVRERPCPEHKGKWWGIFPLTQCVCEGTGWLPEGDTVRAIRRTLNPDGSVTQHEWAIPVVAPKQERLSNPCSGPEQ